MQYDKEFKLQALELSDEIGVKAVNVNIRMHESSDFKM